MKYRVEYRFNDELDNGLPNPIRDGGYTKFTKATRCLWNFNLPDRRREIRPRRHPVPQLVEILRQVLLKHRDRFIVDAGSASVGLHFLVRVPHGAFRNTVRFCRCHVTHPRMAGWRPSSTG